MLSIICFSKNRAAQLDVFLRSLYRNAPYFTDIHILYTADGEPYWQAYDVLKNEHPTVNFVVEDNFREQVISLLSDSNEYFAWATDDSIFYRKTELTEDKLNWIFKEKGALALNTRMGLNITLQNHWAGERSDPIEVIDRYQDLILWDAKKHRVDTDVGRICQNDCSIMPRDLYLPELLKEQGRISRPRHLDDVAHCGRIFDPCLAAAFEQSCYLNIPVNLCHVLDDGRLYADNYSKFVHAPLEELNRRFLDGERIDLDDLLNRVGDVDCGRKELTYNFAKR